MTARPAAAAPVQRQTLVLEDFPRPEIARALSPNGRAHWASKRMARMDAASLVVVEATRSGLRPIAGPVRLTLTYVYPEQRKRDIDNLTTGVTKVVIDTLVRGRWIAADDSEHVRAVTVQPVVERGRRALIVTLEPAE